MSDLKKEEAVVKKVITGKESSSGNEYVRVRLHTGQEIDFYNDDFIQELKEFQDEYEGLICEIFYEDRGYTVGKVIVPANAEKAGELLDKKSEDFDELSEEEKEDLMEKVERIFERERGNQEGLDAYET